MTSAWNIADSDVKIHADILGCGSGAIDDTPLLNTSS